MTLELALLRAARPRGRPVARGAAAARSSGSRRALRGRRGRHRRRGARRRRRAAAPGGQPEAPSAPVGSTERGGRPPSEAEPSSGIEPACGRRSLDQRPRRPSGRERARRRCSPARAPGRRGRRARPCSRSAFRPSAAFNKRKAEAPEARERLAEAVKTIVGERLRPVYVLLEGERGGAAEAAEAAAQRGGADRAAEVRVRRRGVRGRRAKSMRRRPDDPGRGPGGWT